VRKVPEPGTETCVILFRGRPGVQETSVFGGVTAVCVVFPVWRVLQSGLLCEQPKRELKVEVRLFVPSPEIEYRNEVDASNWANRMQELCYVFTISIYLAFLLYCCLSINFVCLLLNKNALRNETSAVMNYITQLK
jgi:hypothetical protein